MKNRLNVIMFLCSLLSTPVLAQSQDTVRHQTLMQEIEVVSEKIPSQFNASTPTQVLTKEKMDKIGAIQVSDALNQMAGVTIKDYGGVGGVKTVSARGLGSQFTTLTIDGVAVTDCQNGQIDLSRYLVGNSSYVGLYQGQRDDLFQTARTFAAGSIVNMETMRPTFNKGIFTLEGGSYGYLAPTLQLDRIISRKVSASIWANYTQTEGNYPFTVYYTQSHNDSTSVERRSHSDMRMATVTGNLFATLGGGRLDAKVHFNSSFHNLPGPATFYYVKASEHTDEDAYFAQVRYEQHSCDSRLRWQVIGKAFASDCIYEDSAANGAQGFLHNEYHQQEYYVSGTALYELPHNFTVSFASDEALAKLQTNLSHDNDVDRLSSQNVLAVLYGSRRVNASANILGTLIRDINPDSDSATAYQKASPYLSVSFLALEKSDSVSVHRLRLRYFFKENYRVPTFNELYYFTMRRSLRPEKAMQHNVGFSYHAWRNTNFRIVTETGNHPIDITFDLTADAYYNMVTDKLVAIPTQNLFLWSMINLGQVEVKGVDVNADLQLPFLRHQFSLSGNYSYQQALDMTDPTDKTYRQQIPYTPRHSGGLILGWNNPWCNVAYNVVFVGDRYRLGQNTANNLVEGYVDQGVSFSRKFNLRHGKITAYAQVFNIFDVQYEVVKSYPMMGRNYRLKLTYSI